MKAYSNIIDECSREYTDKEIKQGMLKWKLEQVYKFWTEAGYKEIACGICPNKRQVFWKFGIPIVTLDN